VFRQVILAVVVVLVVRLVLAGVKAVEALTVAAVEADLEYAMVAVALLLFQDTPALKAQSVLCGPVTPAPSPQHVLEHLK
jgi:hypothetical protein